MAVATGGSDGVEEVIARRLAQAGAEVVLPVRSPKKGEAAAARIRADAPSARVTTHPLDLSSLRSVRELVAGLRAEGRPVHLLVTSAGVMRPPQRRVTEDGFELQMAPTTWATSR